MKFTDQPSAAAKPLGGISDSYLTDEASLVAELAVAADAGETTRALIQDTARLLVEAVRRHAANDGGIDAF